MGTLDRGCHHDVVPPVKRNGQGAAPIPWMLAQQLGRVGVEIGPTQAAIDSDAQHRLAVRQKNHLMRKSLLRRKARAFLRPGQWPTAQGPVVAAEEQLLCAWMKRDSGYCFWGTKSRQFPA